MMIVLNRRMVYGVASDTSSTELSSGLTSDTSRPVFSTLNNSILVTREQWTDPIEHSLGKLKMVGITVQTLISILNFLSRDRVIKNYQVAQSRKSREYDPSTD